MPARLIYRTYLLRLWLYTLLCAPAVFCLFALLINPENFKSLDSPLELAFYLGFSMVFILPVFLYVIITSFVVANLVKTPRKMRTATISAALAGLVAGFFWIYEPDYHTGSQLAWGIFLLLLYAGFLVIFGLRLDIEKA